MVISIHEACITTYRRLRNLKLVGEELGIPWQTVYVYLRKAGEPVTGDKSRYGSDTDRLAARSEQLFKELVPEAESQNEIRFQSKVDFLVHGHAVDIKASRLVRDRWAFSLKKQELLADFFVCFAFNGDGYRCLLIPGEICRYMQTISLAKSGKTKWWDYEIQPNQLSTFFAGVGNKHGAKAA